MNKFKVGQKLVCIGRKEDWTYRTKFTGFWIWKKPKKATGPDHGEIVTYLGHHPVYTDSIVIQGWPNSSFVEIWFKPLQEKENVSAIELVNKELNLN